MGKKWDLLDSVRGLAVGSRLHHHTKNKTTEIDC